VLDLEVEHAFDLVLMCELLEHVPERDRLLGVAARALKPDGRLVVTFPPYWSPFGGHQQLASTWLRAIPYAHYLPAPLFFRLARIGDNPYMTREDAIDDVVSVRRTRLTIAGAERGFRRAGLRILRRRMWLLRPEYRVRYGVRPLPARIVGSVPLLRELGVLGADYLLAPR
jgi:SAM-dependent methyltransferase